MEMLKPVQLMTVLPGGKRHSPGSNVWQCAVQLNDGLGTAYVKLVPPYQLVREVVCALVAQAAGLPVLAPGVALLDSAQLDDVESRYAFATLAVHTRAAQGIRDDYVFREQLSRWTDFGKTIAFDSWIANSDRTPANLLFRGPSDFLLIDHGEAIPHGMAVDAPTVNRLARLALSDVSRVEEDVAVQRVQHAAAAFDLVDLKKVEVASLSGGWGGESMLRECCRFLADRLRYLDDLIVQSFGAGQQSLPLRQATDSPEGTRR